MDVTHVHRHRVAVFGAGFGGLSPAKRLGRAADVEVTVIDRSNHHRFQPLLYRIATGIHFAIGDLMSLDRIPDVARVAVQSGRHATQTILRRMAGDTLRRPFRYHNPKSMGIVTRFRAVAVFGRMRFWGFPAWVKWLFVHLAVLTGFKNRLSVLFSWSVAFLGRGPSERVITAQQASGRQAIEERATVVRSVAARAGPNAT
jgi:NADH dehydrogenase